VATTFFLITDLADVSTADTDLAASLVRGVSTFASDSTATVTGPTAGVPILYSGVTARWWTKPLNAVTISGTVTMNMWMSENGMNANVGAQVIVDWFDNAGTTNKGVVLNSERGVEVAVAPRAVNNWTGSPTSRALVAGDRLRITVLGNDVGTMATAFTFDLGFSGPTGAADGDSFVTFTETITEQSGAAPIPFLVMARSSC
jgi:hypothetical protein